jgi:hypothetical protein
MENPSREDLSLSLVAVRSLSFSSTFLPYAFCMVRISVDGGVEVTDNISVVVRNFP